MTVAIKTLTETQLQNWLSEHGQAGFRLQQIRQWLYQKQAVCFDKMSSLPTGLRRLLQNEFLAFSLTRETVQQAGDGTVKFLFRLPDAETIETVLIPAGKRRTVCISTQVGCPVRCAFCASGQGGWVRNLNRGEILDQVIEACRWGGQPVTNVVVMGMGEPMLNLDELIPALHVLCHPNQLNLSARQVTISTSGIPEGIRRLADEGRPWNLAVSLHATTDDGRARLIPPRHRHPIAEILAACQDYRQKTNRMVTLEYALVHNQNDQLSQALELAAIARRLRAKVNLIPCNPAAGNHQTSSPETVRLFADCLNRQGVQVSLRQRRGESIQAACGQLRRRKEIGETPQKPVDQP